MVYYIALIVGCVFVSFASVTYRGLHMNTYVIYIGCQMVATLLFLFANSKMSPMHYVVGVNSSITIISCIILYSRGIHISMNTIIGCVLMIIGTYLTFK